jgi:tetratricopeptide (TPR) repeat protein
MKRSIIKLGIIVFFVSIPLLAQSEAQVYWKSGNAKYNSKNYAGAIRDYDKAIEKDPKYLNAYINRGLSKVELRNYTEAIQDYDKAIGIDSSHVVSYTIRGIAKDSLLNYKGAIEDYNKAIRIKPNDAWSYFNRGNARYKLMDYPIEFVPRYMQAYYSRGLAKQRNNDMDGACSDWRKASSFGDDTARTLVKKNCGR